MNEEYRDQAPPIEVTAGSIVTRHPLNEAGRDFVVGDIHGMFGHLAALLDQVGFRERTDRLFSVGDLVDRGPDSREAVAWLDRPWFHACRGNHEQFAIDSLDAEQLDIWVQYNGGEWWLDLTPDERVIFRNRFLAMPLAMEVDTATGVVGIVHADVPPLISWDRFVGLLEDGNADAAFYALWSRNRLQGGAGGKGVEGSVDRVYCGHTPTRQTVQMENVYHIDTGAVYCQEGYQDARLTVVEINPERHHEYGLNTTTIV